ncbi:MAG: hypothetical protein B7Y99_10730 [Caulobacterales bacterium 32-69-10]|nr:MAG: hypothetical protein B7Y99_10730 [Caulobacterales bacterium 32-69-10]
MIEELVKDASARTSLTIEQARVGLSAALALIEKHGDQAKVSELLAAIPGAAALAAEGQVLTEQKSGGLMGGLMGKIGGAGGAAMSDAMAMGPKLAKKGITTSDMQAILPVAMEFVRAKTGRDLLREVLVTIPGLGKLMTGQG